MNENEKWMSLALEQARKAEREGEVPVGAILIKNGLLVAEAHNQPISKNDASAHAEIQLIRSAGKKLKNYRLTGTSLYVTLEPCAMCLGAIIHARISNIFYGASDPKSGVCGSCENLLDAKFLNHKVKCSGGILENECKLILNSFFNSRRRLTK